MNVLKNYCLKVSGFSYSDIKRILNDNHDKYILQRKAPQLFFIKSRDNSKLEPLKCISNVFTTDPNGKTIKIAKTNGKCFNTQLKFGLKAHDCDACYKRALELFEKNELFMTKNGK